MNTYGSPGAKYSEDKKLKNIEGKDRTTPLIEQLLKVWESSVKATHLFLNEDEIENIKKYVPQALKDIPLLIIVENGKRKSNSCWFYGDCWATS